MRHTFPALSGIVPALLKYLNKLALSAILIIGISLPAFAEQPVSLTNTLTPTHPLPDWWLTQRRMLQTNLREIDAGMDVEAYVASLKAAGANVVLFNAGGIVENYPTDLPYHYRNPFLKGDLTRKRLFECMVNGGWLDFYCIGTFNGQEDRLGLDQVENVFRFHAANEQWLVNTIELADVGLAVDGRNSIQRRSVITKTNPTKKRPAAFSTTGMPPFSASLLSLDAGARP